MTDIAPKPGQEAEAHHGGVQEHATPTWQEQPLDGSNNGNYQDPANIAGSSLNNGAATLPPPPAPGTYSLEGRSVDPEGDDARETHELPTYTPETSRKTPKHEKQGNRRGLFTVIGASATALLVGAGALLFGARGGESTEKVVPPDPTEIGLPGQPDTTQPEQTTSTPSTEAPEERDPHMSSTGHVITYGSRPSSEVTGSTPPREEPIKPPVMAESVSKLSAVPSFYKRANKEIIADANSNKPIEFTDGLCLVETRENVNAEGKQYFTHRIFGDPIHRTEGELEAYMGYEDSSSDNGIAKLKNASIEEFDGVNRASVVVPIQGVMVNSSAEDVSATVEGVLDKDTPPDNSQEMPMFAGDVTKLPNVNWVPEGSGVVVDVDGQKRIVGWVVSVVSFESPLGNDQLTAVCADAHRNAGATAA